jgi:hypothetical protein
MAEPAASEDEVVDDALHAAAGMRTTARWIASAFGGITGLGILAPLVTGPGDAGFDEGRLLAGVLLGAAGATLGILMFARVLAPVALTDAYLRKKAFDVTRIPGHPFGTFDELTDNLEVFRGAAGEADHRVGRSARAAKQAEKEALAAEKEAAEAKNASDEDRESEDLKAKAAEAEKLAKQERDIATKRAQDAVLAAESVSSWSEQFQAREAIRKDAYRLQAADEVADRYYDARWAAVAAVFLVALGLALIALAPRPKSDATEATPPSLVLLRLERAGQRLLGCQAPFVYALRITGDAKAPTVITLPSQQCPRPRMVTFTTTPPTPLGSVTTVPKVPKD